MTLCCWDKIPDKHNLKGKRFILAHGFRGFSPQLAGSKIKWHEKAAHFMEARKGQSERTPIACNSMFLGTYFL